MSISLNFHYSGKEERAPRIPHSLGLKKTRLHLYDGYTEGNDKFAVFAKKITFKENQKVPEGLKGRFIYQQITGTNDYYKINKRSLQKRLGINSAELKDVKDHNYGGLIEAKLLAKLRPASGEQSNQSNSHPNSYLESMLASNATLMPQIISEIPKAKRKELISEHLEQIGFFCNAERAKEFLKELRKSDFSTHELMDLYAESIKDKIKDLDEAKRRVLAPEIFEFCERPTVL